MEFTPVSQLTYAQCVAELDNIVRMMQGDRCDIDHLADYTRRATELSLRDTLASLRQE